jgi:diguanylate cyclase (GGDEF)-like protein/PAS domain S-box-containing protein
MTAGLAVLRRDKACAAATGCTVLAAAWYVAYLIHPFGIPALGWLPSVVGVILFAGACRSTARAPGLSRVARRFWRQFAVGALLVGFGQAGRALRESYGSSQGDVGAPEMTAHLLAVAIFLWALLRLPLGLAGRRRWWTFSLDMGTVMVAGAAFTWHLAIRVALARTQDSMIMLLAALAAFSVAMVAVFVVGKVTLTGSTAVDGGALRLLGIAVVIGGLGSSPERLMVNGPSPVVVVVTVICPIAIAAAYRQRRAAITPRGAAAEGSDLTGAYPTSVSGRPPRRPFSLLPYVALAATCMLLLVTAGSAAARDRLVVAAACVLAALLVMARQTLALVENSGLLTELGYRERRFRSLVQNSSDLIVVADARGVLTYLSPGARRLTGRTPQQWHGRELREMLHPDDATELQRVSDALRGEAGAVGTCQVRLAWQDGSARWVELTLCNLLVDPAVAGLVGNMRDISDEREFQLRLTHQANHDALTGLANRELFQSRLDAAVVSHPADLAVLLIDLNEFKAVNDTLGHAAGDQLLLSVAERLVQSVRHDETVARLGGDEFAVLLRAEHDSAMAVIDRISVAFVEPLDLDGHRVTIGASIGVALGAAGSTAGELLRHADVAMYGAKQQRDCSPVRHMVHTPGLDLPLVSRRQLEDDLRRAIDEDELRLVYQPIVALADGRVVSAEALVRWEHPQRGLMDPVDFVPLAESTDLMVPLGRWVLGNACEQAADWLARYGERAPAVNVNISVRQLQAPGFPGEVMAVLAETGLPAHRLTVEVTERLAIEPGAPANALWMLHDAGVKVSMDDFGTGNLSLAVLDYCPVDELKLDRTFTAACQAPGRGRVASSVLRIADGLQANAVAEGVETDDQAHRLAEMGYRYAQGYLFSAPTSPERIEQMLDGQSVVMSTAG